MDYKEYIYAVYKEKSFSGAARKLFVSQPWLSEVVKRVEMEINAPIFDRSTKPISLTEAGQYYIDSIEKIMAIEEEMREHFNELSKTSIRLNIGSSIFCSTYILPGLLEEFRKRFPEVILSVQEGTSHTLIERLMNRKLDIILDTVPVDSPDIVNVPLSSDEILLAVPAGYEINERLKEHMFSYEEYLARDELNLLKAPVRISEFKECPFLLMNSENDIYARSMEICKEDNFTPTISMYLTQQMTAYYLVSEGQGVTFLRSSIPKYQLPTDQMVFYRIDSPLSVREAVISYSGSHVSPILRELIDFLEGSR